jgi:hypothetical protein
MIIFMKLFKAIQKHGISPTRWALDNGFPQPKITGHILWEKSQGEKGKPMGLKLCRRTIEWFNGDVFLGDLRPDLEAEIKRIYKIQSQAHGN